MTGTTLPPSGVQLIQLRFRSEQTAQAPQPSRPRRILLVEDNNGDVLLIREALSEHKIDCDLYVVRDGERADRLVQEVDDGKADCPDLIILDLNLPRMTGHQVLGSIRGSLACANSPVVILTSSDVAKDRERAAQLGASRYLRKPMNLDEFLNLGSLFKGMLEDQP